MTTNPQLPNHLIRELMHIIRLENDGEAMAFLALSGKEPFSVFRYVVENYIGAFADEVCCHLQCLPLDSDDLLRFDTSGSMWFIFRFVRELDAMRTPFQPLPCENIIKLRIYEFDSSFTPFLNSWPDIEVLIVPHPYSSNAYFNEVNDGNILLTNLQKLEMELKFDDLLKIMSTTSFFPLPEDVSFRIERVEFVPDLSSFQTFPKVKHLKLRMCLNMQLSSAMFHQFSSIINCFTGLETAKLAFWYDHVTTQNDFAEFAAWHEWLRNTNYSFPIEVDLEEFVRNEYPESPDPLFEQLKSIGYEEDGRPYFFVVEKQYGNVKLNHQIKFMKYL